MSRCLHPRPGRGSAAGEVEDLGGGQAPMGAVRPADDEHSAVLQQHRRVITARAAHRGPRCRCPTGQIHYFRRGEIRLPADMTTTSDHEYSIVADR
eukprot:CAMPEP_0194316758 /NCGR_PEP_ID=MMETSP0171-20130528/13534_1 /TAXON_ID=218684 /ORGANISM="Corethron pennatum, Strain L29A3" /LENGTH=95 /DNA_ID=CAMNT_0039073117 /DNA_START=279 /DNA_END=566 /DNA_ORIENTATION=-